MFIATFQTLSFGLQIRLPPLLRKCGRKKMSLTSLFVRISGCFCLSRKRQEQLRVAEDAKKKENKKPDKYKHKWMLNPRYWSICYVENHGFFCVLCKKHSMIKAHNKSQTFIEIPSKRLKDDSLKTHMASTVHSSAMEADLLQCMSIFHQNYVEKNELQTTVLQNVFATAFF